MSQVRAAFRVISPVARAAGPALVEVVASLLLCWPVLLAPGLLTLLAAGTEQGRDAMSATASLDQFAGQMMYAYYAATLSTVLATLAALHLLEVPETASDTRRYAAHFVPGLVGLLAGYGPQMLYESYHLDQSDQGFFLASSHLFPVAFMILARDILPFQDRSSPIPSTVLLPITGIGTAVCIVFLANGSASMTFSTALLATAVADIWLWRSNDNDARFKQRITLFTLAGIAVLFGALMAIRLASWSLALGTYATAIVSLNAWTGFGILMWFGLKRWPQSRYRGFLVNLVIVLLIFLMATGPFGLSDVRTLPTQPRPSQSLKDYASGWLHDHQKDIATATDPYPIFIVNSDGGGIRSAWWTANLLGRMEDAQPGFGRHVFAMSGVSGGSLGIALFVAQLEQAADESTPPAAKAACAGHNYAKCAEDVLGADLLAPAVAGMLTVDAPRTILRTHLLPDRAVALESAFEEAWKREAGTSLFSQAFSSIWTGNRSYRVPILLLNTTDAVSGRRLVMAPVTVGKSNSERGDLAPLFGPRDVRLSTAVLLSARFPTVSPAAWIALPNCTKGYAVVDGGFADNSGARTASEALTALLEATRDQGLQGRVRPVAIMIANDPVPDVAPELVPEPQARPTITTLGSLLSPVLTLDRLRQINTQHAKDAYKQAITAAGGIVLDGFQLHKGSTEFPLGWMLAPGTRQAMDKQLDRFQANPDSAFSRAVAMAGNKKGI